MKDVLFTLFKGFRQSREDVARRILQTLEQLQPKASIAKDMEKVQEAIDKLKARREKLLDLNVAGHLSDVDFANMVKEIGRQLEAQKELLACKSDALSPFSVINRDRPGYDIRAKNMAADVIGFYNDDDLERLKQTIWQMSLDSSEKFSVEIQPEESELLALYRQKTLVESIEFDEENEFYILTGYRRRLVDEPGSAGGIR